jgi:hypothetical protein
MLTVPLAALIFRLTRPITTRIFRKAVITCVPPPTHDQSIACNIYLNLLHWHFIFLINGQFAYLPLFLFFAFDFIRLVPRLHVLITCDYQ